MKKYTTCMPCKEMQVILKNKIVLSLPIRLAKMKIWKIPLIKSVWERKFRLLLVRGQTYINFL